MRNITDIYEMQGVSNICIWPELKSILDYASIHLVKLSFNVKLRYSPILILSSEEY